MDINVHHVTSVTLAPVRELNGCYSSHTRTLHIATRDELGQHTTTLLTLYAANRQALEPALAVEQFDGSEHRLSLEQEIERLQDRVAELEARHERAEDALMPKPLLMPKPKPVRIFYSEEELDRMDALRLEELIDARNIASMET